MANETLLVMTGVGVPPYSARGLTQTLDPIEASAQARRTVNGELVSLSSTAFRKYRSTISGNDQKSPAFNRIWPGNAVTVDCIAELAYETATGTPERTVVSGSSYTDGDFTYYRPQLSMMVLAYNVQQDEYGAAVAWTLQLEEI